MKEEKKFQSMPRREFLRGIAGGALALGTGSLLAGGEVWAQGRGPSLGQQPTGGTMPHPNATPFTLYLTTFLGGSVIEVDSLANGTVQTRKIAQFGTDSRGRTETTAGVVVGPSNNLFVFSPGSDQIFILDRATGNLKRRLQDAKFINVSHDGAIGPDGLLYTLNAPSLNALVGSNLPDAIERFDPVTGDHIDTFINSNATPEIRGPFSLLWGPDGDLYVTSVLAYGFNPVTFPYRSDHIARYDGKTGRFKGFVVEATHLSFTLAFLPDGHLLVPSHFFNRVYIYDVHNGKLIDAFVDVPFPISIAFGPDRDLYVTSFTDQNHLNKLLADFQNNVGIAEGAGSIQRFDGKIGGGTPKSILVSGVPFAGFLAFA